MSNTATWWPADAAGLVTIKAEVSDAAGNTTVAQAQVDLAQHSGATVYSPGANSGPPTASMNRSVMSATLITSNMSLVLLSVPWAMGHPASRRAGMGGFTPRFPAIAAWFGLLITGFNLLPMGQLDGGHIAYAVLGRLARPLAWASFAVLIVLGFTTWSGWFTWALFAAITGLAHPSPLNDITPLDWGRRVIGALTAVLFILLITPRPF